jgi:hypothetical protein
VVHTDSSGDLEVRPASLAIGTSARKRLVSIVVIAAAAAAAGSYAWHRHSLDQERAAFRAIVDELQKADERNQQRLRAVEKRSNQFALGAGLDRLSPAAGDTDEPNVVPSPGSSSEPGSIDETEAVPGRDGGGMQRVVATMEGTFEKEPVEQSWSRGAEAHIHQTVVPFLSGRSEINSIECRSSMCRMEATLENIDVYRKFSYDATHSAACTQCFFMKSRDTADGRPVLRMYMARKGASLPRAPR